MKRFIIGLAMLGGCDVEGETMEAHTVKVRFLRTTPDADTLTDAVQLLGLDIVMAPEASLGTVVLTIDPDVEPGGWLEGDSPCYRVGWAYNDPESIAHELGHALGLVHVNDRDNLMHKSAVGGENYLTDEQIDELLYRAWYMQNECQ